jgi:Rrf2 family protein
MVGMRVSAKADYAVRACAELAASPHGDPVPAEILAQGQDIPTSFLERILGDLRRAGIVTSVRGRSGGYRLARPAADVTLAEVIRAVDGPLVTVRDERPPSLSYDGSASSLLDVWVALRTSVRSVLDEVTLAGLVSGELPDHVKAMAATVGAWDNP